jgi:hypothetical protein
LSTLAKHIKYTIEHILDCRESVFVNGLRTFRRDHSKHRSLTPDVRN